MEHTLKTLQEIQRTALLSGKVNSFFLDIFADEGISVISVSAYKTEDFENEETSFGARIYKDTTAEEVLRIINNIKALCD